MSDTYAEPRPFRTNLAILAKPNFPHCPSSIVPTSAADVGLLCPLFSRLGVGAPRNAPKSVATPTHRGPRPIAAVPNRHSGRCSAHADRVRATGSSPQPPCNDPLGNTDGSMRQSRGSGRASVPHCGCRLPAAILIGFSHPKARYFLVATRKYPKKRSPRVCGRTPRGCPRPRA